MTDAQKIFDFTSFVGKLKGLERFVGQFFWRDYPPRRYESVADHTWRMALLLAVSESRLSKPLDFKKAMTMLLIHDLPEIIAGDASPLGTDGTGNDSHAYNREVAEGKFQKEDAAAREIFGTLPEDLRAHLYELWREFEEQSSYEARVVKALDKLEAKLQALEYTGGVMFPEHRDFTMRYGNETYAADPFTETFGEILLDELRRRYRPFGS